MAHFTENNLNEPLEWEDLWATMKTKPYPWVETTENMYNQMLDVLPPAAMGENAFLVGEPYTHNEKNEPVFACFVHSGKHYQARYMTLNEFDHYRRIRL